MPARTYMGVDARRDHSIRVPRPDVAGRIGAPDACTSCHRDQSPGWAAKRLAMGRDAPPLHYGDAIAAGRAASPGAEAKLLRVVDDEDTAPIVRATAASLLARDLSPAALPSLEHALHDPHPLLRLGALRALEGLAPAARPALAAHLLRDPLRAIRIESARVLAAAPTGSWRPGTRAALAAALREYRHAHQVNADLPEAQLALSRLAARTGDSGEALRRARRAVALAPDSAVAWNALAERLRSAGREGEAEAALRKGLESHADSAALHFALGLSLVRQARPDQARVELARAHELALEEAQRSGRTADGARFALAYALALHGSGEIEGALEVLEDAQRRAPGDTGVLFALATIERDRGPERLEAARRWSRALSERGDPRGEALLESLRR